VNFPTTFPVLTDSQGEERGILQSSPCSCGERFTYDRVRHRNLQSGRYYDWRKGRCPSCGSTREYLFDISNWYSPGILKFSFVILILFGGFGLAVATILPGMSSGNRSAGMMVGPIFIALAGICFWLLRGVVKLDYPVPGPLELAAEHGNSDTMAGILSSLGISMDSQSSDPLTALVGGAAKAGLWQGIRQMEQGNLLDASRTFETVLAGLENEKDPRWESIRSAAQQLLDEVRSAQR